MSYFNNKSQLIINAKNHTEKMAKEYPKEIDECVHNTIEYSIHNGNLPKATCHTDDIIFPDAMVVDMDSVSAILTYAKQSGKAAVLNFASYKDPGGLFLAGSSAQEESLCHESFLYNVLKEFDTTYYTANRYDRNLGLYQNCALYSPNVIFERNFSRAACDVITCAAPNKTAAQKYMNIPDEINLQALTSRIHFVLSIALEQHVDTLILGAYGCGVFGQNPQEVASIFSGELSYNFQRCFNNIIFAIPDKTSKNYQAFEKMFKKEQ